MTNIKIAFGVLVFILILGLVGNEDFKDEVRAQAQYCAKAYEALAKIEGE